MNRYCTIDGTPITDEWRLARSSPYCSDACKLLAAKQRRNLKAGKVCRLCGRNTPRVLITEERRLRRKLVALLARALATGLPDLAPGSANVRELLEDMTAVLHQAELLERKLHPAKAVAA